MGIAHDLVLTSASRNRKWVRGASPHTMPRERRHYRSGEALEAMCLSFWHGGEGCEVAVSVRAPKGCLVGPKYAAGRSSVFFCHFI